jgi:Phosphate transporter family
VSRKYIRCGADYSPTFKAHETQRPKICARAGSATRLKVDSHPIGGRDSVVTANDETGAVDLDISDKRSLLWVRLTETISGWALKAALAPVAATAKPVTAKQLTTPTTTRLLVVLVNKSRRKRSAKLPVQFVPNPNSMYGLPVSTTDVLSSGIAGTTEANGSGLQLSTVRNIALAWVLTLPAAMVISGTL